MVESDAWTCARVCDAEVYRHRSMFGRILMRINIIAFMQDMASCICLELSSRCPLHPRSSWHGKIYHMSIWSADTIGGRIGWTACLLYLRICARLHRDACSRSQLNLNEHCCASVHENAHPRHYDQHRYGWWST
jgi:hypothetical protein